jgi:hypothetical protein
VEVTLTVAAPETGPGPGLYIDSGTGGTETLTPVEGTTATGLQAMLTYLAASAANNTKYVVLVNDDSEMTSLFSSKSGSTGVRITLRGIGTERRIYTHISSSGSYCFTINSGTTLALGTNITLSGDINNVGWIRPYSGGALEMLAGSKIANTTTTHAALISLDGVGSSFTMNNGAAITNNNLYFSESSGTTQAIKMVRENVAAVSVNNGTFTMNGGEISGTNYRGVYIFTLNSLNPPSLFTMKNGVITNNGKSGITFTGNTNSATGFVKDQVYYPWGAGVYIGYSNSNTAKMVMEGGVISDNGNGTPGSGIYVDTDGDPTALSSLVLDGAVAVTNNTVACSTFTSDAADGSCIHLGENFSSDAPIAVDLCILDNSTVSLWKNRQLLYPKLSSGVTIGASHTALFSLAGYYYTPGDPNIGIVEYTNLNYTINSSGVVVQTE